MIQEISGKENGVPYPSARQFKLARKYGASGVSIAMPCFQDEKRQWYGQMAVYTIDGYLVDIVKWPIDKPFIVEYLIK